MQPIAYLFFKDTCRAAMTHYGDVFGTTPDIMSFSQLPPGEGMPDAADLVMHASLRIGDGWIYGSDDPSGETATMDGCNISVQMPNDDETRRVTDALSRAGGSPKLAPVFLHLALFRLHRPLRHPLDGDDRDARALTAQRDRGRYPPPAAGGGGGG
ncbi:MAG: hypothetical protein R3D80_03290 [Paracoccaceae bacterium]